ncbi:MAG: hypothetical protein JXD22_01335 [Sedimentisphaerales bacterium]|nr:hypothetical protein [Sedimentisphaerales bacterium]
MRNYSQAFLICVLSMLFCSELLSAKDPEPAFKDDFSADRGHWSSSLQPGKWVPTNGVLRAVDVPDGAYLADIKPVADAIIEAEIRTVESGRMCFGLILRAQKDNSGLALRYYDRSGSLELLSYKNGLTSHGPLGPKNLNVKPNQRYRMKAAVIGNKFMAKMWLVADEEPQWQFKLDIKENRPGRFGLLAQEAKGTEFDNVRIWTDTNQIRKIMARENEELLEKLRKSLKMKVVPSPIVRQSANGPVRCIDIVTIFDSERYPIDGTINVSFGETRRTISVKKSDVVYGVYSLMVNEPSKPTDLSITFDTSPGIKLTYKSVINPTEKLRWRDYVTNCLDTLIEQGRDRYGPVHTPVLMSILDVYTLNSPEKPPLLDAMVRTEERPTHGRLSPGGSNLWMDQSMIKTMYHCTKLTGDTKYTEAADAYLDYTMKYCKKPNGLFYWGSHSYWNAYTEQFGGDGLHEILIKHPDWANMYRINPQAVKTEIDQIWKWHIFDKKTGMHNRHDDGNAGCDFAFSGGSFAIAFSFMYQMTGDKSYLDKAITVANWHWNHRNLETGLVPDAPHLTDRYDGQHCLTSTIGPHVSQLLKCYELTGNSHFRDVAIGYIKAFEKYAWDPKAGTYYAMIKLDGTPVPDNGKGSGYDAWAPKGHVDVWRASMYSYEMPLIAAQAAVYAYMLSGDDAASRDKELLKTAFHWADVIEKNLPASTGRRWKEDIEKSMPEVLKTGGTYAENYGRAISFFVNLYHASGQKKYISLAESIARETIDKLYVNGIFRGHPAKPYYQTNDGVGFLLHAFMELDALPGRWELAF